MLYNYTFSMASYALRLLLHPLSNLLFFPRFYFLSAVSETLWKDPIEFREDKKGGPLAAMYLIYGPYVKREFDYIYIHTNYSA